MRSALASQSTMASTSSSSSMSTASPGSVPCRALFIRASATASSPSAASRRCASPGVNRPRVAFDSRSKRLDIFKTFATAAAVAPPGKTPPLPFVRLAGQEEMKLALLLNVVDPGIGGVLIMGDRGTGKSVAVRMFFSLLSETEIES